MTWTWAASLNRFESTFLTVFLDAALKSALVLAMAGLAVGFMRRSSAAARHLVWFLAIASLCALPGLSLCLPAWHILPRWLNVAPARTSVQRQEPAPPLKVETRVPLERVGLPESGAAPDVIPTGVARENATPPAPAHPSAHPTTAPETHRLWRLLLLLWITGTALSLIPTMLGILSLWRLAQTSRRETRAPWLELLRSLLERLNFRRAVTLLKTERRRMPMTWGVVRPKLLLPEQSESWTEERRRVVMLHELAHAKRLDYLTNLATQVACALYWFNPLVWYAARQMIAERERACDDIVLRHGAKPADYAEQILQIAAGLSAGRFAAYGGIPMARPSNLENRLRAILDNGRNRAALTRVMIAISLAALGIVTVPMAMLRAESQQEAGGKSPLATSNSRTDWGGVTNGVRARLAVQRQTFGTGQPVLVTLEITNASDRPQSFFTPSAPQNFGLEVSDAEGRPVAYVGGLAQVAVWITNVGPHQVYAKEFDLADFYYLRKPGRYSVKWPGDPGVMRGPDGEKFPLPATAAMSFEVVSDSQANDDGDPVGRLLPLLKEHWYIAAGKPGVVRSGSNHEEVPGRLLTLEYNPTGYKADSGLVWLWLTEEPAAEQVSTNEWPPASEYLGKVSRWHVYFATSTNAFKAWPSVKSDAISALGSEEPVRSVRERIQRLIQSAPVTTNLASLEIYDPAIRTNVWDHLRADVVRLPYMKPDAGLDFFCTILNLPAQNRFYVQWDKPPVHYYGPFEGDPFKVLSNPEGVAGNFRQRSSPLENSALAGPDNPLGLEDETIVRFFNTGKLLRQVAMMASPHAWVRGGAEKSVDELCAVYINRDELGNDPFGPGKLRLERLLGKLRVWSVGPDGKWDGGKQIEPGDPELKGDLGVELEDGKNDVHWLAGGAVLDYLQGQQTARYLAKKGANASSHLPRPHTSDEKLNFGPVVDGLSAAVELVTTNGVYEFDKPVDVRFHIRNEADYAIQVAGDAWREGDQMMVEDEHGNRHEAGMILYTGISPIQRGVLQPGQATVFQSCSIEFFSADDRRMRSAEPQPPVGYTTRVPPGKCTVHFRLRFAGWNAQLMDWQGELETGTATVDLREGPTDSQSARRTIDGASTAGVVPGQIPAVSGTVLEARSRQPIETFKVTPGYISAKGSDPLLWEPEHAAQGQHGAYSLELPSNASNAVILVEAEGYAPEMERAGTNRIHDFALQKSNGLDGTVVDSDGRPTHAEVVFGLELGRLTLDRGNLVHMGYNPRTHPNRSPRTSTDNQGRFHLPATAGAVSLIAVGRMGFAELPINEVRPGTIMHLQPWARIEGTLRLGGEPLTNEVIGISVQDSTSRGFEFQESQNQEVTDANGHFVFEELPPGKLEIYRQMGGRWRISGRGSSFMGMTFVQTGGPIERRYFSKVLQLEPGATTRVELEASEASRPEP